MVVVDASAIVDLVIGAPGYEPIADRLLDPRVVAHAPHTIDVEVVAALRRLEQRGRIDSARARAGIDLHRSLRIERHSHARHVPRMWELRHTVTAADAAYVALAEALDAVLLTSDRKLEASTGHHARIELV